VKLFTPSREEVPNPKRLKRGSAMGSILLLGLDADLASPLTSILMQLGHQVIETNSVTRVLRHKEARAVFVAGDNARYRETMSLLRTRRQDLPLILVNRLPENARWLDALEMGASDYCGAPFERVQIQWLLEGALRQAPAAA
jgi:DNA-binding NtrC family response regulator